MPDSRREGVLAGAKAALEAAVVPLETTLDEYGVENYSLPQAVSGDLPTQGVAQSFRLSAAAWVGSVIVRAGRNVTLTGNVTARLYATTGTHGTSAVPTGAALASATVSAASLEEYVGGTPPAVTFTFSTPYLVAANTTYAVAIEYGVTGLGVHSLVVGADSSSPTHAGNYAVFDGAAWSAEPSVDLVFILLSTVVKPSGLTARRHPERAVQVDECPVVDLYVIGERVNYDLTGATTRVLTLGALARVAWNLSADDFDSGDEALDELLSWTEAALLYDETLGGAASLMTYAADFLQRPDVQERADKVAEALLQFEITYQTGYGNPFEAP